MLRRPRLLIIVVALVALAGPLLAPAPAESQTQPLATDDDKRAAAEAFETGRSVVRFGQQVGLTSAVSQSWDERGETVVSALKEAAASSQARAIELIKTIPGATYESHWISNALVVDGPAELIDQLRSLAGVSNVIPEMARPIQAPVNAEAATEAALVDAPWGIEKVRAPEVWATGNLGGGVIVASLDSGVQFDHPALVDSYRGHLGGGVFNHDYNWFDASRTCVEPGVPCDDFGHGTHTMGTMVGGDGPGPFAPDIGMAPGAQWITVSCGPFFCTDSQLMEAGEWFLAPTDLNGENPDPSRRPDVINNSWGGEPGDPFFLDFVQAWRAAGIVPVFASGNPGPFCGAGGSPGDYLESFSVGATDSEDAIAEFSGRGPSAFGKVNPNVSAPGVAVLSSVPGDGYELFDGTSMATPHAVGAMALMMSADPDLKGDVDALTSLLASTAQDIIDETCGGDADGDPNNVYGEGRIDAAAAVAVVATGGTITGTVTNAATGDPIPGAEVTATSPTWESRAFTDANGVYRLFVPADTYVVIADSFGFEATVVSGVTVVADQTTTQNLGLDPLPTRVLRGEVRTAESRRPIIGATVEVVGVPVEPVTTDRDGRYRITLPVGSYTITASRGGCTLPQTQEVELVRNQRLIFHLATKIDDFGHGCRPVAFDWIEADVQSGVYGDDIAGRLDLPFPFPFYSETYERLFFTTNGYVNFIDEFSFSNFINTAIPSAAQPNAAIYALWQDLIVDDESRIDYASVEVRGRSVFVIEWENIARLGSDSRLDMEVKLWEDGTIDLLYGEGVDELNGGAQATIGLENADATDAFQFSFRESILEPNTAWRFEKVPTGVLTGTVTNANDGLPVAGATVTATPGDRTTMTDENGQYRLVLVPGRYEIGFAADDYQPDTKSARIRDGQETISNVALDAAEASIAPTEVSGAVALGQTTDVTLTVTNTGTVPLEWELKERQESVTPPSVDAPVVTAVPEFRRNADWVRPDLGPDGAEASAAAAVAVGTLFDGPLDVIIDDPVGDATGAVDIDDILAGTDGVEASFRIDFSPESPTNELAGFLFLDTDQDPTTGLPAEGLSGLPSQDVGMEFFVDLFSASFGEVFIVDAATFELIAVLPAAIDGQSLLFDLPLEALGGDDGAINVASVLGDFFGPTDWAPDAGHGELLPFRDTPWMTPQPATGTTPAGGSTEVTLTLGGPDVDPGSYLGSLTLVSNDPRAPQIPVTVSLDVALPADFGEVAGTVLSDRTSAPVAAEVTVSAERDGAPFDATATTGEDGSYRLFAPEGTWPISVTADGFQPFDGEVVVTAGAVTAIDVLLTPGGPLIEISAEEGFEFELPAGASESRVLNIASNGTTDVVFDIFERMAEVPIPASQPTQEDGTPYRWDPTQRPVVTERMRSQIVAGVSPAATLETIIDDPDDDAVGAAEIVAVRAGVDGSVATMSVDFGPDTALDPIFGLVLLDTDQDPATGGSAESIGGLPTQEVGIEYFIDLFAPEQMATLVRYETGEVVAFLELRFEGQSLVVDVPLDAIPGEDGAIDVATWFFDGEIPSDWAPDEGRGRIDPPDVPWLSFAPDSGTVPPGAAAEVTVTADATGLAPGTYGAELVVTSNDPSLVSFPVPVSLVVLANG
ncbi:MAG: carboxypeptidase regulatory-like domain-containing protein [Acidimicrobiia bacterium]|nr:carboxypeptidase regulatory-like domain-containing protein [Acidimicrobiia bacterium]